MPWLDSILQEASERQALVPEHLQSKELLALIAKRPRIERVEEIIRAINNEVVRLGKWKAELVKERRALQRKLKRAKGSK